MDTNLGADMIKLANKDKLPVDHEMRVLAHEFESACFNKEAKKILGAWARARKCYCKYTGEPLISKELI